MSEAFRHLESRALAQLLWGAPMAAAGRFPWSHPGGFVPNDTGTLSVHAQTPELAVF